MSQADRPRSGFVAIVGRPNVGKSTLLNAMVGEKVSIVSPRPHTTRQRILGILSRANSQAVFIDTPGHAARSKRVLHRLMSRAIHQAVGECDLILLLIEAHRYGSEDRELLTMLKAHASRIILVLNKVDKVADKKELLPLLGRLQEGGYLEYVPVSALKGDNLDRLQEAILAHLPVGEPLFESSMTTDKNMSFRAAECIREQLFIHLRQELPYGLTVEVEHLSQSESGRWLVHGLIWLEKATHKPIVIGKDGQLLKRVGSAARLELASLLGDRVHLELWVKIREHWSDSERELKRLGFDLS